MEQMPHVHGQHFTCCLTNCALTNYVLVLAAGIPKALQAGQEDSEGNLRGQFHLDATVPGIQGICCKGELKKYHMPLGMLFQVVN
jgi:hypothetical protein